MGGAIARRLAAAGATVVISDAHAGRLERARHQLGVDGAVVDVGDPVALRAHLQDVEDRHGRIDIMVSSAGINQVGPTAELSLDRWQSVMDVNLTAPFVAARFVLPAMIERRRGTILHVASIAAWQPALDQAAYQASKAGLVGFTKALALEVAPVGVRVNAIAPGLVDNPHLANVYGEDGLERLRRQIPMGRPGLPEEVAAAATWLCSDEASYVTGECLTVSGGWYMRA